jgi:hypothetical protein
MLTCPVSDGLCQRVLGVLADMDGLGYQPNALARSLRRRRTSTLGLIIPDTNNAYFAEVARGVGQVAFECDFTAILNEASQVPWTLLSAGDPFETFRRQLRVACQSSQDFSTSLYFSARFSKGQRSLQNGSVSPGAQELRSLIRARRGVERKYSNNIYIVRLKSL